jgi:hypothetical protein
MNALTKEQVIKLFTYYANEVKCPASWIEQIEMRPW